MPPKRTQEQLLALAEGPVEGWLNTPVAGKGGWLSGPYLAAFLKYHALPVSKEQVDRMNGQRLWQGKKGVVSEEFKRDNRVLGLGVLELVRGFNQGFCAPAEAKGRLVDFVKMLPGEEYRALAEELRRHYEICDAFTTPVEQLAVPPSHLDLFKDARVAKSWRDGTSMVLISMNSLLRVWVELMPAGWNVAHVARDVIKMLEAAKSAIDDLHASIDTAGPSLGTCEVKRVNKDSTLSLPYGASSTQDGATSHPRG